jgi:hypothetical protein
MPQGICPSGGNCDAKNLSRRPLCAVGAFRGLRRCTSIRRRPPMVRRPSYVDDGPALAAAGVGRCGRLEDVPTASALNGHRHLPSIAPNDPAGSASKPTWFVRSPFGIIGMYTRAK